MAAWSSVCLGDIALLGQDLDPAVQEIIPSFPLLVECEASKEGH